MLQCKLKLITEAIAGLVLRRENDPNAPLDLLAPVDALLSTFPRLELTVELAKRFLHGQRLALGKEALLLPPELGRTRVYCDGRLLGTGLMQEYAVLAPERLIATAEVPS